LELLLECGISRPVLYPHAASCRLQESSRGMHNYCLSH
jgi:hypothetical protein